MRWLAAAAAAGALALAGCGGDDEDKPASFTAGDQTATAQTSTAETAPTTDEPRTVPEPARTGEDQPGGAGDEAPNATQALITGRGGRLSPATVSVPPFIAITLELRSADGQDYSLGGGGRSLAAGEGENSATATFDGLRPGRTLALTGPQGRVTITADAEPGP